MALEVLQGATRQKNLSIPTEEVSCASCSRGYSKRSFVVSVRLLFKLANNYNAAENSENG